MREVFNPQAPQLSDVPYDILAGIPSSNKNYQGSLDGALAGKTLEERQMEFEIYQKVRGGNNNIDIPGSTARMASIDPR